MSREFSATKFKSSAGQPYQMLLRLLRGGVTMALDQGLGRSALDADGHSSKYFGTEDRRCHDASATDMAALVQTSAMIPSNQVIRIARHRHAQ